MKTRYSTPCCLLLLLAVPAWGQSPPQPAGGEAHRPLNLSLPRDVLGQSSMVIRNDADETAARNLRQEGEAREKRTTHQRYGTGYEARQRGMTAESSSGHGGGMGSATGGGAGMGGGGRGGMGRGR
ncbi:MAG: hypothetical protein AB1443_04310 [Pseudomonadota bacterium]